GGAGDRRRGAVVRGAAQTEGHQADRRHVALLSDGGAVLRRLALIAALALAGCYLPSPADKGFKCTGDNNYLCPEGQSCDRSAGLCVSHQPDLALVPSDLGFALDLSGPPAPRT